MLLLSTKHSCCVTTLAKRKWRLTPQWLPKIQTAEEMFIPPPSFQPEPKHWQGHVLSGTHRAVYESHPRKCLLWLWIRLTDHPTNRNAIALLVFAVRDYFFGEPCLLFWICLFFSSGLMFHKKHCSQWNGTLSFLTFLCQSDVPRCHWGHWAFDVTFPGGLCIMSRCLYVKMLPSSCQIDLSCWYTWL